MRRPALEHLRPAAVLALVCFGCAGGDGAHQDGRGGTVEARPPGTDHRPAPGRYTAAVILDASGRPVLSWLAPAPADRPAGASPQETVQLPGSGVPAVLSPLAERRGPETRVAFLLQLDARGRALSADPVGVAGAPPEVLRGVASLLLAATYGTRARGDPLLVAVDVILPAAP